MILTKHFDYSKHFFERLAERTSSKQDSALLVKMIEAQMRDKYLEMAFTYISRGYDHTQAFLVDGFVVRHK